MRNYPVYLVFDTALLVLVNWAPGVLMEVLQGWTGSWGDNKKWLMLNWIFKTTQSSQLWLLVCHWTSVCVCAIWRVSYHNCPLDVLFFFFFFPLWALELWVIFYIWSKYPILGPTTDIPQRKIKGKVYTGYSWVFNSYWILRSVCVTSLWWLKLVTCHKWGNFLPWQEKHC